MMPACSPPVWRPWALAAVAAGFACSPAAGDQAAPAAGYASLARTTLIARHADLEASVTFWRDIMGFTYRGDPSPVTNSTSESLGWSSATRWFTSFSSIDGSTVALLMVEDDPAFPSLAMPREGAAYGSVVLVHTARNIREVYARALAHEVEVLRPLDVSETGRSLQMLLRAPTGHMVEVYEMLETGE